MKKLKNSCSYELRRDNIKLCFVGTSSVHVLRWIKYFAEKGHVISLITLSDIKPFNGIRVFNLEPYDFFHPKNVIKVCQLIYRIKKLIKEIKPDIIHVHQISSLAYIIPFINFHPYILSAWGSDILVRPNEKKRYSLLASNAIIKADLLHCDGFKTYCALEKLGGSSQKIVKVYYGTNIDNFNPQKWSNELRNHLGIESSIMVISTRNLMPIYNIETLIRAIPKVLEIHPYVKFIIVGSGPENETLQKLANDLCVSTNTIFTGRLSESETPHYYASADIYVSTSLSDAGLAASTAEAMACGLPVIVTEDPDNRDWIKDGINGFIIPVKKPDILAKRIIELINNNKLRKEMGRRNREIIIDKNNYLTEMGKMEIIYKNTVQLVKK